MSRGLGAASAGGARRERDETFAAAQHAGLFGPGSVTWRVHSDPVYPVAMLRALVMQVLSAPAMAVVFATAPRVDDPWERLRSALKVCSTLTFGDAAEAAIMGARERAVRAQVRGVLADGTRFTGTDPEVGRWLHVCQVSSALDVTRRAGLELGDAAASQYLREQARAAAVLGLDPDEVPASQAELLRCLRTGRSRLKVGHEARSFLTAIVDPGLPSAMLSAQRFRPAWAPVAGLAFPALPGWARAMYGPPPPDTTAAFSPAATTVALHTLRDSMLGRITL